MKKKYNPAAIGIFITGAVVILFVSVALFGGGRLFRQTKSYLLTFHEAVTGLNIGAPVKMLGVDIGEVREIWVQTDPVTEASVINVVISLDQSRFTEKSRGPNIDLMDRDRFNRAVERGFSGRLEILSLLSGQLYISLGQIKGGARFQLGREADHGFWEIPTVPSTQAEIMASVMRTLDGLSHFDLKTISQQMTNLLVELRADLGEIEFGKVNARVLRIADKLDSLLEDPSLRAWLTNLNLALIDAREFAGTLNRDVPSLLTNLGSDLRKADAALTEATAAFRDLKLLIRPDSPVGRELFNTLEKAGRTLDSLRELSDELRRNPNSILTGRAPEKP